MTSARLPLRRLLRAVSPLLVLAAFSAPPAQAEAPPVRRTQPHAGYVYPAGGQAGTRVVVDVGGQYLRNLEGVLISGEGVRGKVKMWIPPARPLDGAQRRELLRRMRAIQEKRSPTTPGRVRPSRKKPRRDTDKEPAKLPDHPLLEDLESRSPRELEGIARYFFRRINPLQRKRAIAELARIEVTIDEDAEPGVRDLRLVTKGGVTNPLRFRVGLLPEVREWEPRAPEVVDRAALDPPVVVNGQILPRDVDRFRLRARKGQRLVFRAEARGLVPYQADSVPGWMQTTLTLYDASGKEVAFADEYRFDPDPVLFFEVPADGEYVLEVQDAISRGRDDFVYRVTVGELPFVTRVFPLGGCEGTFTNARIDGWNLGLDRVPLDTRAGQKGHHEARWRLGEGVTNAVPYAVDTIPEKVESEPNDTVSQAPVLVQPVLVNGRIGRPDDVDVYAFEGRGGREVVVEVTARRLGSPVDSLIRLVDAKGGVIAWNDDHVPEGLDVRGLGLQTHHADSYLRAKLPKSGTYYVHVADVTRHGSDDHAYRLRIGPPMPDVELYVVPSSINVSAGRAALVSVCALRKDGFDEEVEIELARAPDGFDLGGATIPPGEDRVTMTLTAPRQGMTQPASIQLVGKTRVNRKDVLKPVVPADDVMQAFLWRHIVPARDLVVAVVGKGGRWIPVVSLDDEDPVRVPIGRKAVARFAVNGRVPLQDLRFALVDPPKGLSLGKTKVMGEGFTLEILADRTAERTGRTENLIVEAFVERPAGGAGKAKAAKRAKKKGKRETRRFSLGFLPAVPVKIVRR